MGGVSAGGGDVGTRDLNGLGAGRTEFAEAMEFSEGAGLGSFKAGFGAFNGGDVRFDALLVEAEAVIAVTAAILPIVLFLVIGHAAVSDGNRDGPGAAHAPLSDGDALNEVKFEDGAGLERIDIILFELFKKLVAFCAEDDRSGGKAVFYCVLRGALFAFRGDVAAGKRAIAARSFYLGF